MNSQQCWKAKLGGVHFFKVQSGKKNSVCGEYGNTGCGVFKRVVQNQKFLPKNQLTQKNFLNFENWTNGEPQQLAKIRVFKVCNKFRLLNINRYLCITIDKMVDIETTIKLFFGPPEASSRLKYVNDITITFVSTHFKKNLRYAMCTTNRYC